MSIVGSLARLFTLLEFLVSFFNFTPPWLPSSAWAEGNQAVWREARTRRRGQSVMRHRARRTVYYKS